MKDEKEKKEQKYIAFDYETLSVRNFERALMEWEKLCHKNQVFRIHDAFYIEVEKVEELHKEFMKTFPELAGFMRIEKRKL